MMWKTHVKAFRQDLPRWMAYTMVLHAMFVFLLAYFSAPGYPAITWMAAFDLSEFASWKGFLLFIRELKTGIPPLQSICELVVFNLTGSFYFFSHILYRFGLVFVYLAALYWRPRSPGSFLVALVTGTVFLWATVLLHCLMPMTYDIFFPALGFMYLFLQPVPTGNGVPPRWVQARSFLSGVMLSLLELTRPFVLFMLPVLLLGSLSAIRPFGRKCLLLHLLPVLVLSGGWHLKLYLLHERQIIWSNHTGFNLFRAWKDIGIETPPLLDESGNPVSQSDPKLLNTIIHSRHNELLKESIKEGLLRNPAVTLRHAFGRLAAFLKPGLTMYRISPKQHPVLWVYAPLVWLSAGWLFWRFLCFLVGLGPALMGIHRHQGLFWEILGNRENQLIVLAVFSTVILAMGESGEEVRLLISVLPWMAAYPVGGVKSPDPIRSSVSPSILSRAGV